METWLELSNRYDMALVGSAFFGKSDPSDIDLMLGVPPDEIAEVERRLLEEGWQRNAVNPETRDEMIISSFSRGHWDIQLATPEGWRRKRAAMLEIRRQRLHIGKSKCEIYQLYAAAYRGQLCCGSS